jgi:hypothetical protein
VKCAAMSQRKGPLEGGPLSLAPDVYSFYSRASFFASGATHFLDESRRRPKRHNRRIERAALWHTVLLDEDCGKALEPHRASLLLPPSTDTETRYELQAGIRTVHAMLPFTPLERRTLRDEQAETGNTRFDDEKTIRATVLFERWHEWLWMDEHQAQATSADTLGASAVLAEGCLRLSHVLSKLLGYDQVR